MKKILKLIGVYLLSILIVGYDYPSVTNTFSPGTVIQSSKVNQNFNDLIAGMSGGLKKSNWSELYINGYQIVDINRTFYPVNINASGNFTITGRSYLLATTNIGTTDFVVNTFQNRIGAFTGTPQYPFSIVGNTGITGNMTITGISSLSSTTSIGTTDFVVNTNQNRIGAFTASPQYPFSINGNLGVTGNVYQTGDFSINTNKFNVTASSGNTLIAGTLGVTGAITGTLATSAQPNITSVGTLTTLNVTGALKTTGDFSINTNKFNVTASSGNTLIAGTLGVTGAITGTLATSAQPNITSLGTLTALQVDNLNLNGNTLSSTSGAINLIPTTNQNLNIVLASTGNFVVNTNQLYIDTSSANIGIGTATPGVIGGSIGTQTLLLHLKSAATRQYIEGSSSSGINLVDTGASSNQKWFGIITDDGKTTQYTISDSGSVSPITTIDHSNGNFGIGTTDPDTPLEVQSTGSVVIRANYNNTLKMDITASDGGSGFVGTSTAHPTIIQSNNSGRIWVTASGNIGMTTSAPDKSLEVNSASGSCLRLTYNDSNGSATNYTDMSVSSGGDLTINPSGKDTQINGNLVVTGNSLTLNSGSNQATFTFDSGGATPGELNINASAYGVEITNLKTDLRSWPATSNITGASRPRIIEIGDWDMDSTPTKSIQILTTDLSQGVHSITVTIRGDSGYKYSYPLSYSGGNYVYYDGTASKTTIYLERTNGGTFDNTNFDATSYNRGYITLWCNN